MSIERYRPVAKQSANARSRQGYAQRIKAALGKSVVGFIEAGQELIDAQAKLKGQFEEMVQEDLGISLRMAQMLMKIAMHPIISDAKHVSRLPRAWSTLYELTKVPTPRLEAKLKDGTVSPFMERKDAIALVPANDDESDEQFDVTLMVIVHVTWDAKRIKALDDNAELYRTSQKLAAAWQAMVDVYNNPDALKWVRPLWHEVFFYKHEMSTEELLKRLESLRRRCAKQERLDASRHRYSHAR
jgi:hypothetical protein